MNQSKSIDLPGHYLDWSVQGKPAIWRYLIAIVAGYAVWVFGGVPEALLFPQALTDPTTKGFAVQWAFLPGLLGMLLITRLILGRPAYSLLAATRPLRWGHYFVGILIGYAVATALLLFDLPFSETSYVGFAGLARIGASGMALLLAGFAIQTAYEELFYRGLLMQFAWRIKAWLPFALALQAVLFAVPHFGNVSSWNGFGMVAIMPYLLIALSWGWVAWRTGSLLIPMGLHFANNTYSSLVVETKGDIVASFAPFAQETPSLVHGIIGVLVQTVLTVAVVEGWMRFQERRSQGIGSSQDPAREY